MFGDHHVTKTIVIISIWRSSCPKTIVITIVLGHDDDQTLVITIAFLHDDHQTLGIPTGMIIPIILSWQTSMQYSS